MLNQLSYGVAFCYSKKKNTFLIRIRGCGLCLGNKRLPEGERKRNVGLRLPEWMISQILEIGTMQEVLEAMCRKKFKKRVIRPKE
jgi:hypothetical protein